MVKGIVVRTHGGPEVLQWQDIEVGDPGDGEVRLRHEAVGLNFVDVYNRTGLYKTPTPFIPGGEGAGTVVATGAGVESLKAGDRVCYSAPGGSYCEERLIRADLLIKVPDSIDLRTAAAMTLKGLTAQYLLRQTFRVEPGQTILFHAAAGGVGLIACQWAKALGATVIGTVGSPEKAELARANGCDHVIDYSREDFVTRVAEITGGEKCHVVYDSVGQGTFPGSLDCLRPLGTWALFGQSSGTIQNFDLNLLAQKGSLFATRPTLFTYIAKRETLERMANELFEVVASGKVRIAINQEFALSDAASAHRALESRETTGASVLIP